MNRRQFLFSATGAAAATSRRAPNIVFILADDLGWADTTPYGADLHETPNLERLARESVRFTRAYAAAPVCSPTRASIHTGKYPARLGLTIWREAARNPPRNNRLVPPVVEENLAHSEVTLAERLGQAGYFNAHIGKWHLGDAEHYPETHGFEVNIGGSVWGAPATYWWPFRGDFGANRERRYVPGLVGGKQGEYLTDRLTDEALRQMDAASGRPLFLNLCYHTVHTPIEGKPELVEHFRRKIAPGMNHRNAAFAAMVRSLDDNVGRILARIDAPEMASRTVVVFTSDNGGYINPYRGEPVTSNAPLRSGKGSLYEGGIRVPLMIRWPGAARAGAVCDEPVSSIDFYPTLLEMAGLAGDAKHNATVDGASLAPLLRSPGARLERDELFFHYPHYYATTSPVSAVVARDWKLIEYFEDSRLELYDLAHDPGEQRDLAAAMPDRARQLHARLKAWRESVRAPMPSPNPDYRPPAVGARS